MAVSRVLDVFKAAFPDERQQYETIGQLIAQSDDRVKISGEGDEDIDGGNAHSLVLFIGSWAYLNEEHVRHWDRPVVLNGTSANR